MKKQRPANARASKKAATSKKARQGWAGAVNGIDAAFRREFPEAIIKELLAEKDRAENPRPVREIAEEYGIAVGRINLFYKAHGGRPPDVLKAVIKKLIEEKNPRPDRRLSGEISRTGERTRHTPLEGLESEAFFLRQKLEQAHKNPAETNRMRVQLNVFERRIEREYMPVPDAELLRRYREALASSQGERGKNAEAASAETKANTLRFLLEKRKLL